MIWKTINDGDNTSTEARLSPWCESREIAKQLRRFLVVGTISVGVDLTAYWILVSTALAGVASAKGVSYLAGVVVGFVLNKRWTFESPQQGVREPLSYLGLYSVTLLVNVGCNQAVLAGFGSTATSAAFLVATGVTTVLNFLGMRLFAFRAGIDRRRQRQRPIECSDGSPQCVTVAA